MWTLCTFVLASVGAGSAAYLGTRKAPRAAFALTTLLLAVVCGKATLDARPDWEWLLCPWTWYAFVQPLAMYPLAAMFFGVAATRLPVRWNRAVVALVAVGVIAFGAHRNAWIAWPQDHGRDRYADTEHHLQQSTHYTCGPAACVAALSHCGVSISEREMARLCLTRTQGSRLFDLYRGLVLALDDRPVRVSIRNLPAEDLIRDGTIAVSSNRGGGHAICIVGRGVDALVHDPLDRAAEVWTLERLRREYRAPAVIIERIGFRSSDAPAAPR